MIKEVTIPEIGEKVESGKVVSILVKKGDLVNIDDGIIEFETEKAVVEIPSPVKGRVNEILVSIGDEMRIGSVIAKIDTEATAAQPEPRPAEPAAPPSRKPEPETVTRGKGVSEPPAEPRKTEEKAAALVDRTEEQRLDEPMPPTAPVEPQARRAPAPASPSVRRLARELGADINVITGSGPGGRITDTDVKEFVKGARRQPRAAEQGAQPKEAAPARAVGQGKTTGMPDFGRWGEVEHAPISTVRRITAESTAQSWDIVPHVTQFDKSDITHLQGFMDRHAKAVERSGGKLTITIILLKVIAEALKRFPRFNASIDLDRDEIIFKKYVHIGLAVDTERGLLVPVVRDVDQKSLMDLAVEVLDLAERARNKRVTPDELEGGTFTISNQGGIGGTDFTPIVLWPQAAILGVSRASVEPKYISGEFKPRTILPLSLSYDHRIIDGADAARFLRWVCDSLENPFAMYME